MDSGIREACVRIKGPCQAVANVFGLVQVDWLLGQSVGGQHAAQITNIGLKHRYNVILNKSARGVREKALNEWSIST